MQGNRLGLIIPVLSLSGKLQPSLFACLKKRKTGKRQTKAKRVWVACGRFVERLGEVDYILRERERKRGSRCVRLSGVPFFVCWRTERGERESWTKLRNISQIFLSLAHVLSHSWTRSFKLLLLTSFLSLSLALLAQLFQLWPSFLFFFFFFSGCFERQTVVLHLSFFSQ